MATLVLAPPAKASDLRISARSAAEAYSLSAARSSAPTLTRRRLVQYLSLEWSDILAPKDPSERYRDPRDGQLQVVTQFRLRHAFGDFRSLSRGRARTLVDPEDNRQLDLLFAYLQGRRIARVLDFRVGRQLDPAKLDFFAMDGLSIELSPPGPAREWIQLGLWAGAQLRSDSPLGIASIAFESFDEDPDPARRPKERGYLLGASLSSRPLRELSLRVGMRRAYSSRRQDRPEQSLRPEQDELPAFSQGVEQSLLFSQLSARALQRRLFFNASASYDLARSSVSLARLSATGVLSPGHRLTLSWSRSLPVLDLDSIFSVFDLGAFQEGRLRYTWTPTQRWQLTAGMQLQARHDPQASQSDEPIAAYRGSPGGIVSIAYRYRGHRGQIHNRIQTQGANWQLSQLARWDWTPHARPWGIELWVHHAQAQLGWRRHALSSAVAGNLRLLSGIKLRGMVELMSTETLRQSTRIFASLTFDAMIRGRDR